MAEYTNHLIHETSPYLLQHAHNPVDWYPWGEEALQKALNEDKPILVSIGYSACHWCHVMEKESFEDAATAEIMNSYFVNIKIDREERPDLDHIYMSALQTMTGTGGWPLNVFLTPDKKPFYGGTYYPPQPMFNRPSWKQVLMGVVEAFAERREKLNESAEGLTKQLLEASNFEIANATGLDVYRPKDYLDVIYQNIMQSADTIHGGFGAAPKFPQTFTIGYLQKYYHATGNPEALQQFELSLKKMIYGGINDQLGGGFARYSTDAEWLVPHFEKMLYDNALLVQVMCDACMITKNPLYKEVIAKTLAFVQRELMSEEGGFYSALDADSEGVEGRYYLWTKAEVDALLGEEAPLFCDYFDITEEGNWEHHNIINSRVEPETFATSRGLSLEVLHAIINKGINLLFAARSARVRPSLDDKILLSWNALMNTACSRAYAATGNPEYREMAIRNMNFLLNRFYDAGSEEWRHVYNAGQAKMPAFLDDYANLVQALIVLQEVTGNQNYLSRAGSLIQYINHHFGDPATGFYFYTHQNQQDVIIRTKELYDGATPSSNAIMAWNLRYLSLIFGNQEWKDRSDQMITSMSAMVMKYPVSFGVWANLLFEWLGKRSEVAIVGEDYDRLLVDILPVFMPGRVVQSGAGPHSDYPLLKDRGESGTTYIYFCSNYVCEKPVKTVPEFLQLVDREAERDMF